MKAKISKALSNFKTAKSVSGSVLRTKAPKGIRSFAGSVLGNSAKPKNKKK
jgi:hypothetical protein